METVVETPMFSAKANKVWSAEEYEDFVCHMAKNPRSGNVIPDTGGVRKVRWVGQGKGKRGGVRVIYVHWAESGTVWLLTMYAKNERENIAAHELRRIKEALDGK